MCKDDLVFRKENGEYRLQIMRDHCAENPREWDNVGSMVCWHRQYSLGDEHDHKTPDDFLLSLAEEIVEGTEKVEEMSEEEIRDVVFGNDKLIIIPLYLYDHSGITMSTAPFNYPWDSGQVGWIYVTLDVARKKLGGWVTEDELRQRAEEVLKGEVRTYDDYLRGDVYGFILEKMVKCDKCGHVEYEPVDSCWGFYGEYAKEGIKEHLPEEYHELLDDF